MYICIQETYFILLRQKPSAVTAQNALGAQSISDYFVQTIDKFSVRNLGRRIAIYKSFNHVASRPDAREKNTEFPASHASVIVK